MIQESDVAMHLSLTSLLELHAISSRILILDEFEIVGRQSKGFQKAIPQLCKRISIESINFNK
jgi:hypothetical protein